MASETTITLVGNLVDDPEFRFTAAGHAVVRFRVASTPRYQDRQTGEWKDGTSLFLTCTAWSQLGEHIAESLQRGTRVIVHGRLRQRTYENRHRRQTHHLRTRSRRGRPLPPLRHRDGHQDQTCADCRPAGAAHLVGRRRLTFLAARCL